MNGRIHIWPVFMVCLLVGAMTCAASSIPDGTGAGGPGNSLNARFDVAARKACQERNWGTDCVVVGVTREQLPEGIAHYEVVLKVGPGPFDSISLHRLVLERKPGIPVDVDKTFFFLHGSANRFLYSMVNAAKTDGLGMYLARRNVDVWGIDLRWVQLPETQTDFSFMKTWDFDTQVSDILLATRFARHARRVTGQHFDQLNLAGASLGASLVFAVANADAALPAEDRDVAGLIPLDTIYALPPESAATRGLFCNTEKNQRTNLANGIFMANSLAGIRAGRLALADPGGISPTPPLTNQQVALNNAAALSFAPALSYHIFSVTRNSSGGPSGGRYTDTRSIFEILSLLVPYRALATMADYFAIPCGDAAQQHVAHLRDISVPVLYIGYAGGFGREGLYATTLLGSADVTTLFIQLMNDAQAKDDFGHMDWLQAGNAETLIWDPIWRWIASR